MPAPGRRPVIRQQRRESRRETEAIVELPQQHGTAV